MYGIMTGNAHETLERHTQTYSSLTRKLCALSDIDPIIHVIALRRARGPLYNYITTIHDRDNRRTRPP